jgi:anti-sigma factor RsiW
MERAEDLPCVHLVEIVTEYLEGGLTADERALFEAHLLDCEGCVNYVDQMRTTIELTGRLQASEMPPELEDALTRAFRGWHSKSPG